MNETIGVKGGKQDRLRSLRIKKEIIKKLQEMNEEKRKNLIEKTLKKNNLNIKFVPISLKENRFI